MPIMLSSRPLFALRAPLEGISLCLKERALRKLCRIPWLLGIATYILSIIGAYYTHPLILHLLVNSPEHWWQYPLFILAWTFVAILLCIASMLISIVLVMILSATFQTDIARFVLGHSGIALPPPLSITSDTARSLKAELLKLLWLIPVIALLFFFGLIPWFAPIVLVIGWWLLGYQFIDTVLDTLHLGAWSRLRFGRKNFVSLMILGLILSVAWAVPFLGILLQPVAVASAAWFVAQTQDFPRENETHQ